MHRADVANQAGSQTGRQARHRCLNIRGDSCRAHATCMYIQCGQAREPGAGPSLLVMWYDVCARAERNPFTFKLLLSR